MFASAGLLFITILMGVCSFDTLFDKDFGKIWPIICFPLFFISCLSFVSLLKDIV